jgi:hypothetical protein
MPEFCRTLCRMSAVGLFLLGYGSAAYADCDEYDPAASTRSATIVLRSPDKFDDQGEELRTFVETGSLGSVRADLVSSNAKMKIRYFFANPVISRYSRDYGEQLKGIAVEVIVEPTKRPFSVSLRLHQVCARHFRNSFLSY